MKKEIRKITVQMAFVTAAVLALGIWQHEFIWHGFEHNPYVNGAIIATTIAAMIIAFVNIGKLSNEIKAFEALRELWSDVQAGKAGESDPFRRHMRCAEPGIIFHHPRILGHVYDLIAEEIARTGSFRITVETMHMLVDKIEHKVNEEKSFLSYLSGLLVFMGLVGTFMGLLAMVGSIGSILASLQATNSGGTDGITKLLGDLQKPLGGMATGFAASLFGLFGSLVVGLLARFTHQAATVLKRDFEGWLAALSQIDQRGSGSEGETAPAQATPKVMELMARIVADYSRSARGLEQSVDVLARLVEASAETAKTMSAARAHIEKMAREQELLRSELRELQRIPGVMDNVANAVDRLARSTSDNGIASERHLDILMGRLERMQTETMREVGSRQQEALSTMSAGLERVLGNMETATEAGRAVNAEILAATHRNARELTQRIEQIGERQAQATRAALASLDTSAERMGATLMAHQDISTNLVTQAIERMAQTSAAHAREMGQTANFDELLRHMQTQIVQLTTNVSDAQSAADERAMRHADMLDRATTAIEKIAQRAIDDGAEAKLMSAIEAGMSRNLNEISRLTEGALAACSHALEITLADMREAEAGEDAGDMATQTEDHSDDKAREAAPLRRGLSTADLRRSLMLRSGN